MLRLERLTGEGLASRIGDLAALRIAVFRDWPYLYDGDLDYERGYIATYLHSARACLIAAFDDDRVVGAATALPLADEPGYVTGAFRDAGIALDDVFYLGESVLLPAYRGRGIGVGFFAEREAVARAGGFAWAYFCGVQRAPDDPRRPPGFVPLDAFWGRRGYRMVDGLTCRFSWREIGEAAESGKIMQFWRKRLD